MNIILTHSILIHHIFIYLKFLFIQTYQMKTLLLLFISLIIPFNFHSFIFLLYPNKALTPVGGEGFESFS